MKEHIVTLHLSIDHAGQMLDGIRCREEAYRRTAKYWMQKFRLIRILSVKK